MTSAEAGSFNGASSHVVDPIGSCNDVGYTLLLAKEPGSDDPSESRDPLVFQDAATAPTDGGTYVVTGLLDGLVRHAPGRPGFRTAGCVLTSGGGVTSRSSNHAAHRHQKVPGEEKRVPPKEPHTTAVRAPGRGAVVSWLEERRKSCKRVVQAHQSRHTDAMGIPPLRTTLRPNARTPADGRRTALERSDTVLRCKCDDMLPSCSADAPAPGVRECGCLAPALCPSSTPTPVPRRWPTAGRKHLRTTLTGDPTGTATPSILDAALTLF